MALRRCLAVSYLNLVSVNTIVINNNPIWLLQILTALGASSEQFQTREKDDKLIVKA